MSTYATPDRHPTQKCGCKIKLSGRRNISLCRYTDMSVRIAGGRPGIKMQGIRLSEEAIELLTSFLLRTRDDSRPLTMFTVFPCSKKQKREAAK